MSAKIIRFERKPDTPRALIRITASTGREPLGRSRAFRLSESALAALIAEAARLERISA